MIDHLIITERKYYSFKNSRLLDEIAKSQKYVVRYKKEEERLKIGRKEGLKEGEEKGELKKAIEMAKIMKKDGKAIEEIMRYTKLSKEQIEKL